MFKIAKPFLFSELVIKWKIEILALVRFKKLQN